MVPYDLITVKFTYHPEQDPKTPVTIRPDGNITLDGIGVVRAAGLTPEELGREIAAKSSKRLRDPEVLVTLTPICAEENIRGRTGKCTRRH